MDVHGNEQAADRSRSRVQHLPYGLQQWSGGAAAAPRERGMVRQRSASGPHHGHHQRRVLREPDHRASTGPCVLVCGLVRDGVAHRQGRPSIQDVEVCDDRVRHKRRPGSAVPERCAQLRQRSAVAVRLRAVCRRMGALHHGRVEHSSSHGQCRRPLRRVLRRDGSSEPGGRSVRAGAIGAGAAPAAEVFRPRPADRRRLRSLR